MDRDQKIRALQESMGDAQYWIDTLEPVMGYDRLVAFEKPLTRKERLKDWLIDSTAQLFIRISRRWAKQLSMDLTLYLDEGNDYW